jgi:hypothetical protein
MTSADRARVDRSAGPEGSHAGRMSLDLGHQIVRRDREDRGFFEIMKPT